MNVILAVWEFRSMQPEAPTDARWLAYMLSTSFHETAQHMWPIEEYGKGEGHSYGEPDPETGQTYYGRGFVQLTWRDNYARATDILGLEGDRDIEQHADRALDCLIATRVMFQGMQDGWFTGKKLGNYFNDKADDPVNARQIINGNDQDDLIAGYHEKFLDALDASYAVKEPVPIHPQPAEEEPIMTVTVGSDVPIAVRLVLGANVDLIDDM